MRAHDRADVNEKVDRRVPVLPTPKVAGYQERIAQSVAQISSRDVDDVVEI